MSKYEHYPQAIEGYVDFAACMSQVLNDILITVLGKDAAWENHVAVDNIPDKYLKQDLTDGRNTRLWELRAQANSLSLIEADHQVKKWAETVCEVNETCKQQRKTIEVEHNAVLLARKEISRLDKVITERKDDVVNRFQAINILIASSIRDGDIGLAHWRRDERLKHIKAVIDIQISEVQRNIHSYNDDF
jgi:hypothetical protein